MWYVRIPVLYVEHNKWLQTTVSLKPGLLMYSSTSPQTFQLIDRLHYMYINWSQKKVQGD